MLFYTIGQSQIFLAMLYAGVAIGLWLELINGLRKLFDAGVALSLALDLTFCAGVFAVLTAALIGANEGDLRLYALMGALCGFILYSATAGPLMRWAFSRLWWLARRAVQAIGRTGAVRKIFK